MASRATATGRRSQFCASCGVQVEAGGRFCGSCGTLVGNGRASDHDDVIIVLPDTSRAAPTTRDAVTPSPDNKRQRLAAWLSTRWWLLLVGIVVVALFAAGAAAHLSTRDELDHTKQQLAATEGELDKTADEFEAAKGELATTTAARDDLDQRLQDATTELSGVRTSLNDAESRIGFQANQIEALKSCLNGVGTALSYVAYDDYYSASAALEAVDVSCQTASAAFN